MKNIAIIGNSWGDEGKGSVTHNFSKNYDWVIRFGGGANAGHTIYRDGKKFIHNLLPSVDYRHSNIRSFLGSGMVIDVEQLFKEVSKASEDYPGVANTIYVDPDAFAVLPEHKEIDKAQNSHIGSTNRGIGPAYTSKINRRGVRIKDIISGKNNFGQVFVNALSKLGVHFTHVLELYSAFSQSKLLFEGAQGVMLDINHGIYPYVSCSDATIAGAYACGFNFVKIDHVYGVVKCYTTKVGEGPFPTELSEEESKFLRERGKEYGATTGRPRRIGHLDLAALNYACKKGGTNSLIMTKFDILNGLEKVRFCYKYEKMPVCPSDFFTAKPQYMDVKGWKDARNKEELKEFLWDVEFFSGCPVSYVSVGTGEADILKV